MTLPARMKFGIFLAPFHHLGENPTLGFERDLELIRWLDHLGYDEARPAPLHHLAEGHVGHPGHGCQDDWVVDPDRTDIDRLETQCANHGY